MTDQFSLEGAIQLRLYVEGEAIQDAEVTSTRPIPGDTPFCGYEPEEVLQLLPLVYAVCGTAQGVAALRAIEAADEMNVVPAHERARELLVAVETAREHWATVAREMEQWFGVVVSDEHKASVHQWPERLRGLLYPDGDWALPGGGRLHADYAGLHELVDEIARVITALVSVPGRDWDRGAAGAQRAPGPALMNKIQEFGLGSFGVGSLLPLPMIPLSQWRIWLARDADARFRTRPTWEGVACETGPLARQYRHPLVAVALARFGVGVASRQLARLVELMDLPERLVALVGELTDAGPTPVSRRAPKRSGVGVVEAARGRLVHWVAVDRDLVNGHRILAPTEWNFHPDGPLARGLRGKGRSEGIGIKGGAEALLRSLDPCVRYSIEVEHA